VVVAMAQTHTARVRDRDSRAIGLARMELQSCIDCDKCPSARFGGSASHRKKQKQKKTDTKGKRERAREIIENSCMHKFYSLSAIDIISKHNSLNIEHFFCSQPDIYILGFNYICNLLR